MIAPSSELLARAFYFLRQASPEEQDTVERLLADYNTAPSDALRITALDNLDLLLQICGVADVEVNPVSWGDVL